MVTVELTHKELDDLIQSLHLLRDWITDTYIVPRASAEHMQAVCDLQDRLIAARELE